MKRDHRKRCSCKTQKTNKNQTAFKRINNDYNKNFGREFKLDCIYETYGKYQLILLSQKRYKEEVEKRGDVLADDASVRKFLVNDTGRTGGEKFEYSQDIFNFIRPTVLWIKRDRTDYDAKILCDYKDDPEHGLEIRIKDWQVAYVGEPMIN